MLRGLVMITCTGAEPRLRTCPELEPFLKTLLQATNVPRAEEIPVANRSETGNCEYTERK